MKKKFIVIEGNIGAGKTSLTTKIGEQHNAQIILEKFDNPFLAKFYQDQEKYSFQLEMSFLAERYQQFINELGEYDLFKSFIVSDYFFSKSLIFSQSTLSEDEYKLYRNIYSIIYKSLPSPDLYVYLYLDIDNLMKNIQKRGREYEKNISKDYLHKIQEAYFEYFRQHPEFSFLVIDTNGIDFVNNQSDYQKITNLILEKEYPKGITRIQLKQ